MLEDVKRKTVFCDEIPDDTAHFMDVTDNQEVYAHEVNPLRAASDISFRPISDPNKTERV